MLPSIAVALMSLGVLNRDGILVVGAVVVGLTGLAALASAIWAIAILAFAVEAAIHVE